MRSGSCLSFFSLPTTVCAAGMLFAHSALVRGAVVEAWVQRHSSGLGSAEDLATKVISDNAGNVFVAGRSDNGLTSSDILVTKYSGSDGSIVWQQRHNGPGNNPDSPGGIALDPSGDVVLVGASHGIGTAGDYYIAKYSGADGTLLWEQRYNGTGNYHDWGAAVAVDSQGNVVVTGRSAGTQSYDYYTAKHAAADGALLWGKRYDGPSHRDDEGVAVGVDAEGNAIVTGTSESDFLTIKYASADGAVLWERRSNGGGESARALAVDRNGDVIVIGGSHGLWLWPDFCTVKYAGRTGVVLWERRYNGPANSYDEPHALALDAHGNVVVTGQAATHIGGYDFYTAKYAATNGALIWEKFANGPSDGSDSAQAIAVDARGDVAVTGEIWVQGSKFDMYTAKYAANDGATIWEQRYNGPGNDIDVGLSIAANSQGDVTVTGTSPGSSGTYDFYTVKYAASDGRSLWVHRYDGPLENYDAAQAAVIDSNENVIVTGTSVGSGAGASGDAYTIKYDSTGVIQWAHRSGGPGQDTANDVAVDASGNVVVTGFSVGLDGDPDIYTARYAAGDGALLWEKRYDGPLGSYDEGRVVAVDHNGDIIVAGDSYSGPGEADPDFYTAKYASADGSLLWEKRYDAFNDYDWVSAMKLDRGGNVVVTGSSAGGPGDVDLYTAKYSGANGVLLWERRYDGPANYTDVGTDMALDSAGNVIVTGSSISTRTNVTYDLYTAKYAAANGALLWEVRYNGPGDLDDEGLAVATDAEGNAVVTGYSYAQDGVQDIYTAKYRSSDGALLWEHRYRSPANNGENVGSAVAIDGLGNPVVNGYSFNGANTDYYTAKYAAADGSLLWERRYDGPYIGVDLPAFHGLAVGRSGTTVVTGVSDRDWATVVYRDDLEAVESARSMLTGVRTDLVTIRSEVTDRDAARRLNQAIGYLTEALTPSYWQDENHLDPRLGEPVFYGTQKATAILCGLGAEPGGFRAQIDRILEAERLLASTAIEEASGIPENKLEQAERFLAKGDANSSQDPCGGGGKDYRNAWKSAVQPQP